MDYRKLVWQQTAVIAAGQTLCAAVTAGVFALLGKLDTAVLLGGIFGAALATLNFFFMAVGAMLAADKAEAQNIKGGQAAIQSSYLLRLAVLFVLLFALMKSGLCNVIALALPLAFTRPILTISEFLRKPGEPNQ